MGKQTKWKPKDFIGYACECRDKLGLYNWSIKLRIEEFPEAEKEKGTEAMVSWKNSRYLKEAIIVLPISVESKTEKYIRKLILHEIVHVRLATLLDIYKKTIKSQSEHVESIHEEFEEWTVNCLTNALKEEE